MKNFYLIKKALILCAICAVTFASFSYTQYNKFTNWDDDFYVTNNKYIREFNKENLKVIFTEDITKNNFHPLCILSLAVNYHFSKLDPHAYYLTNIVIHVINVALVFFLLLMICARMNIDENSRLFIASFGALWFGVHPMHVESVAWIAERKDVLYAFFYFLGMLSYMQFIKGSKWVWYLVTFVLFAASCLSKPMAVVFPLSILCLDVLMKRPFKCAAETKTSLTLVGAINLLILIAICYKVMPMNLVVMYIAICFGGVAIGWVKWNLLTEKVVFFAAALLCGGAAYYTQNKTGAIASFSTLTLAERFMYAAYGFDMYLAKLIDPRYLSTFYPYPFRYIGGSLGSFFYAAPVIAIAVVAAPLFAAWKWSRQHFRIVAFGMGFFIVNVMFVLQFISVGAAIMADRYSYVAYFGLFFLMAYFLNKLRLTSKALTLPIVLVLCAYSGALAYGCYQRTFAWHDAESLLTDAIDKYPVKKDPDGTYDNKNTGIAQLSYKWRGNYYLDSGQIDKALQDYEVLIMLRQADAKVYDRVAVIYAGKKDYQKALDYFARSLEEQNDYYKTYVDRCITYAKTGDTLNSFKDYITAYQLNSKAEQVLSDSSFNMVQRQVFGPALIQYNMLLKINPNNPFYYFYRGVILYNAGAIERAIADWEIAVKSDVLDTKKAASNNLCVAYDGIGNDVKAAYYMDIALQTGNQMKPDFIAGVREKAAKQKGSK